MLFPSRLKLIFPRTATGFVSQSQNFPFAPLGDLARLKNLQDWTPHNAVILPPFLTEAVILHGESDAGELMKNFARFITEWAKKGETVSGEDDDNDEYSEVSLEAEDKKKAKTFKAKQSTAKTLTTITDDCDDVLAFLQAVTVNSPLVIMDPLSVTISRW